MHKFEGMTSFSLIRRHANEYTAAWETRRTNAFRLWTCKSISFLMNVMRVLHVPSKACCLMYGLVSWTFFRSPPPTEGCRSITEKYFKEVQCHLKAFSILLYVFDFSFSRLDLMAIRVHKAFSHWKSPHLFRTFPSSQVTTACRVSVKLQHDTAS